MLTSQIKKYHIFKLGRNKVYNYRLLRCNVVTLISMLLSLEHICAKGYSHIQDGEIVKKLH
jgi:hypothetical protein